MSFTTKEEIVFDLNSRYLLIVDNKIVWGENTVSDITAMCGLIQSLQENSMIFIYDRKLEMFLNGILWIVA